MFLAIKKFLTAEISSSISVFVTKQENIYYCAPAIIQAILKSFEVDVSQSELAKKMNTSPEDGTENLQLAKVLEGYGLVVEVLENAYLEDIKKALIIGKEVVLNYKEHTQEEGHFGIVHSIDRFSIKIHDPWDVSVVKYSLKDFEKRWEAGFHGYKRWMMSVGKK